MLKPKVEPDSEEFVLEQLSVAEQKLVNLAEELSSRELETIRKEMEDEEVNSSTVDMYPLQCMSTLTQRTCMCRRYARIGTLYNYMSVYVHVYTCTLYM